MANPNPQTAHLKPFKPGQSGNPAGRPRKRPVSEAYDDWLREPVSKAQIALLRSKGISVPLNATNADIVARAQGNQAIAGNVNAAKELREAVEGKAPQRIEIATPKDREIKLRIEWGSAPIDVEASVPARVERIIQDVVEQAVDEEEKEE